MFKHITYINICILSASNVDMFVIRFLCTIKNKCEKSKVNLIYPFIKKT